MSRTPQATHRAQAVPSAAGILREPALRPAVVTALVATAALLWSYWPVLVGLTSEWRHDPNYSVGQLVPLVAAYLLWQRRRELEKLPRRASWWGLVLLLVAQAGRFFGLLWYYESAERYALVLSVAGLVLLLAGRRVCWHMRWILLFLALMVPLPGRVHNALAGPLQRGATAGTVFLLDVCGSETVCEGNVLVLPDRGRVGIAEACSGLRMLTAFVVVAATFAFMVSAPAWQRAVLVVSSLPVAVLCNMLRLVVTVVLYAHTSSSLAEHFFHDLAGVTMMPAAVALLLGELWLLRRLVVPEPAVGGSARSGN